MVHEVYIFKVLVQVYTQSTRKSAQENKKNSEKCSKLTAFFTYVF